jgi:site-specific DNA-cytosine methylase
VLNVLDLFAGIGGACYAGHLIGNWRTVCYVEWDKYCQQVIRARIRDGIFDDAPIWDDVQTFDGKPCPMCAEGMMGYPMGATDLRDSVTPGFLWWRQLHGKG